MGKADGKKNGQGKCEACALPVWGYEDWIPRSRYACPRMTVLVDG